MSAPERFQVDTGTPEVLIRVMLTHDRALDDYLADCRARDWSERTISTYAATLERFIDRLPLDQDVSKTTIEDIRRYRASRQRSVSRNTVAGEEAHLASYFGWLYRNRLISRDPMGQLDRTRRTSSDDLDVTTIDAADVQRLLLAAKPGAELNAIAILAYLGPRRHAVAMLRIGDYDRDRGLMRFREKGGKIIWKPVPTELASILDASIAAGHILPAPDDYLVPPQGYLSRPGVRDDRVIWRLVKKVGDNAGVHTHVHALRAAFAVFYLDHNPDDLLGLKDLLGHKNMNTTLIYLRRRNRQAGMERVRELSWGVSPADNRPFGSYGVVEPNTPNGTVEPLVSGGGRIRTSVSGDPNAGEGLPEHLPDALLEAAVETVLEPAVSPTEGTES